MKRLIALATATLIAMVVAETRDNSWYRNRLEEILIGWDEPDVLPNTDDPNAMPYASLRSLDALPRFSTFFEQTGWTTNQFIECLAAIATNNLEDARWSDADNRHASAMAFSFLSEINHPMVTNFFRAVNEQDIRGMQEFTYPGVVRYTNLEPEVISYVRSLCTTTNFYQDASFDVVHEMLDNLAGLPDSEKPGATNRVAKYIYYSAHYLRNSGGHDAELAKLIPGYSNSVQRLELCQHALTMTTNSFTLACVSNEISRLVAIPTNELNNIGWLSDE